MKGDLAPLIIYAVGVLMGFGGSVAITLVILH